VLLVRRFGVVAFALLMMACGGGGSGSGGGDVGTDDGIAVHGLLLRWRSSSEPTGYVVHWGTESGVYDSALDVGAPEPDADGVVSFVLDYPGPSGVVYFALTSYDGSFEMSAFSNEIPVPVR
jgi:hypothetical protein